MYKYILKENINYFYSILHILLFMQLYFFFFRSTHKHGAMPVWRGV